MSTKYRNGTVESIIYLDELRVPLFLISSAARGKERQVLIFWDTVPWQSVNLHGMNNISISLKPGIQTPQMKFQRGDVYSERNYFVLRLLQRDDIICKQSMYKTSNAGKITFS